MRHMIGIVVVSSFVLLVSACGGDDGNETRDMSAIGSDMFAIDSAGGDSAVALYTLVITAPASDATVSGTISVEGLAADFVNVEVSSSGGTLLARVAPSGSGAFSAQVDTTLLVNGMQTLTVNAWDAPPGDAYMHMATAKLTLNVDNAGTDPDLPAAAAAVGYKTKTFDSVKFDADNGPWYPCTFYGQSATPTGATQNGDGSLHLSGVNSPSGQSVCTAAIGAYGAHNWKGNAFGGGLYIEFAASFTGQSDYSYPNGGPALWALNVEQISQGYPVGTIGGNGWPSVPQLQNADGTGPYDDYIELDVMEYDSAGKSANENTYQVNYANWSNHVGGNAIGVGPSLLWPDAVNGVVGSVVVSSTTPDYTKSHKYGMLWVPAVGHFDTTTHTNVTTSKGYLIGYFDDVRISPPSGYMAEWNFYDPNYPAYYPAPVVQNVPNVGSYAVPVQGDTLMSGLDSRHLAFIMGTEAAHPMDIQSVKVWQVDATHNITN